MGSIVVKKSICVDLDGVLARYDGWKGIEHIGDPIPGAREFMKSLASSFRVVVYSTRCKVFSEGVPGPDGTPEPCRDDVSRLVAIVKTWLDKHGFAYNEVYADQGKPFAIAYVDDRAAVCEPQKSEVAFEMALGRVWDLAGEFKPTDVSGLLAEHETR